MVRLQLREPLPEMIAPTLRQRFVLDGAPHQLDIALVPRVQPGDVGDRDVVIVAPEQLDSAKRAGSSFAVSPGSTSTLRHAAREIARLRCSNVRSN